MMYAAHGALMCLATVKIGQLREPVEFAIMDRYNELVSCVFKPITLSIVLYSISHL